ncbi:glutamine amidotransferase [Pseudomonadota bacterium]
MFEFLFKYQFELFERGTLLLALNWWEFLLLLAGIFMLVFIALGYFKVSGRTGLADRGIVALLRSLAIALVVFSFLDPLLEVSVQIPQRNVVGIVIDNSISMTIKDDSGQPRSQFIKTQFDSEQGNILRALRKKFDTRIFRFGEKTERLDNIDSLNYQDGNSDLSNALDSVQKSLRAEPLAGLIVISDGAINSNENLNTALLSLRASGIPVHTIGVGSKQYDRDIELTHVKLPKKVLKDSRLIADVSINQQGYNDQIVELIVEDDSRILHKESISLKSGMQTYKIPLFITETGSRQLNFYIVARADEKLSTNNSRHGMLSVDKNRKRILYFEGEPRFELKFLRRAVTEDKNLQVTGLVRTADAKFYRVGIDSAKELRNGFPSKRDELFSYDAIILGSVEISLLTREQQQLISEFVSQRGGGILMLGGRYAFAEGGYRTTVLEDIVPVIMGNVAQRDHMQQIKIEPSAAGSVHPALLIADSNKKSLERWLTLPPLTTVNPIYQIKPGATLLLSGSAVGQNKQYVALAYQRYGRGKAVAFPVKNSWLWQMHHEIELADQTHEILWRQLLRWLIDSVPQRLSLTLSNELIHTNGILNLRSEVLKKNFEADNQAQVRVVVTAQSGLEQSKSLIRDSSKQGIYETDVSVANPGNYLLHVELSTPDGIIKGDETYLKVTKEGNEFYRSELNEKLLRRISHDTNGQYQPAASAEKLIDVMSESRRGSSVLVRYELWNMPLLFMLLVLLLCGEWGYRRWRNLA